MLRIEVLHSRGLLISFEGIDGCGKTTQAGILAQKLKDNLVPCLLIREPGGTAAGEEIRKLLLGGRCDISLQGEILLYMAARSELIENVVMPSLRAGRVVLCDRFTDSTLAYQGFGGGADLEWIRCLNRRATRGIFPDLTLLLDLPVEDAAARMGSAKDRMESKDITYHRRVRRGYLEIARREPLRVCRVDARDPVHRQAALILEIVEKRIAELKETGPAP